MATKEEFLGLIKYCLLTTAIAFIIISCTHGKTRFFPEGEGLDNPVEVTIIRNRSYCAVYPTAILLDEVPIAFIRGGEYVTFFVESGVHYLRVNTGVYGNFEKENKYYFLISPNFFDSVGGSCSFEIEKISEEEGLKRVMNSRDLIETEKPYETQTKTTLLEKEKPKLASIPKDKAASPIALRRQPMEIFSDTQITEMLERYGFFERSKNREASFNNQFVDNEDGTVTDNATGLMWQEDGTLNSLEYNVAQKYIHDLNAERFAGYSDWRLPNIEQLASLLNKYKQDGLYLDPVFSIKQTNCWTADTYFTGPPFGFTGVWIVDFKQGQILKGALLGKDWGNAEQYSKKYYKNFVKAVRLIK